MGHKHSCTFPTAQQSHRSRPSMYLRMDESPPISPRECSVRLHYPKVRSRYFHPFNLLTPFAPFLRFRVCTKRMIKSESGVLLLFEGSSNGFPAQTLFPPHRPFVRSLPHLIDMKLYLKSLPFFLTQLLNIRVITSSSHFQSARSTSSCLAFILA